MDEAKVLGVLRRVEWCIYSRWECHCPVCGGWKLRGHRDDCKLAALLSEGGAVKRAGGPYGRSGCWSEGKDAFHRRLIA